MKLFSHNAVIKYKNAESYRIGNAEYPASELTKIDIRWLSGSIEIVAGKSTGQPECDRIFIEESGAAVLPEEKKMRTLYENGVLKIQFYQSDCKGSVNQNEKRLKITLPATNFLSEITIASASAAVILSDLSVQKLQIETASGSVEIKNCTAKNLSVKTASGAARLANVVGNTADINAASGNVEVSDFSFSYTEIETASGNIAIETGDFKKPQNGARILFDTACGKIETKEGYISDRDAYLYGNGARNVAVSTASGLLTIK